MSNYDFNIYSDYFILYLHMKNVSLFFFGLYFLSTLERNFIGGFFYEDLFDTNCVKESDFGNRFAYHIWSTKNQESEYMYVITAKRYLGIPVRQHQSFRYNTLIF